MPYERITIDLAIKKPLPNVLFEKPTQAQLNALSNMTWMEIIKTMIQRFKQHSEKINAGLPNEEDTFRAKRHTCNHDIGQPCIDEEDI